MRQGFEPSGLDWSLLAGVGDLRVGSQPRAWNWSLEAGIAVSELGLANRSLKATI